jgi:hypothetical protein
LAEGELIETELGAAGTDTPEVVVVVVGAAVVGAAVVGAAVVGAAVGGAVVAGGDILIVKSPITTPLWLFLLKVTNACQFVASALNCND